MDWREQKREMRRVVHETMKIEALYYVSIGGEPVTVFPRLSTSFGALGDPRNEGWAERQSVKPTMIFMRDELIPVRNAIVWFQTDEAYSIDNVLPFDDITVTVEVARLSKKQYADAFPLEGGTT
jgi:hypothetical protein